MNILMTSLGIAVLILLSFVLGFRIGWRIGHARSFSELSGRVNLLQETVSSLRTQIEQMKHGGRAVYQKNHGS